MLDYYNLYSKFLRAFIKPNRFLKVVFDSSNGTTGYILRKLFPKAVFVNASPDGNFPGHGPNPMAHGAMEDLKKAVRKHRADLGVIFDADGDRVFFVDDQGREAETDAVAYLLMWSLRPKKMIADVRAGYLIRNSNLLFSRVGHYFIKKLMREKQADFAAEKSGHYYFKKFFYCDSGILAAIEVMNAVSRLPYKFSDFIDLLPQYYRSGEVNFKVSDAPIVVERILRKYKKEASKISHLDGLTMEFKDYWFNLRPSNTEPLLRLNMEAKNEKVLRRALEEVNRIVIC